MVPMTTRLRLFVSGDGEGSQRVIRDLRRRLDRSHPDDYELTVTDILADPGVAESERIIAVPTLQREDPGPRRRAIGYTGDAEALLAAVELHDVTSPAPRPVAPSAAASRDRLPATDLAGKAADASPDGLLVVGRDRTLLYANASALSLLGPDPTATLSGVGNLTLTPGDVTDVHLLIPSRGDRHLEVRLAHDTVDTDGLFVITLRDVTTTRAADRATRRHFERFALLVEHGSELTAIVGDDLKLDFATQASEALLGRQPLEVVGTSFLDTVHSSDQGRITQVLQALGEGDDETARLHCRLGPVNGAWRHAAVTITDLRDEPTVGGFVINAHDITAQVELTERLAQAAHQDALTGLPNRRLLMDRLDVALARGPRIRRQCAVLYLDLDGFKGFNDALGHAVGDEVLIAFSQRLRATVRPSDTVARLGGDEFVVVLSDLTGEQEAVEVARRIIEAGREPMVINGLPLQVTTSIGLAMASDGEEGGRLIQRADSALYQAKSAGRDCYVIHGAEETAS